MINYSAKKVLIFGLGKFGGGLGSAKYFCKLGSRVSVIDKQSKEELSDSIDRLKNCQIEYFLGNDNNINALEDIDLVIVSPAVKPNHPFLAEIKSRNINITTEINIFFEQCAGKIVAIIGTNGKGTIYHLLSSMLELSGIKYFSGGNIGISLVDNLDKITSDTTVLLELSSFQLARLRNIGRRPDISIYLNIQNDHIDWHSNLENYISDKLVAVDDKSINSTAIINIDDKVLSENLDRFKCRKILVSKDKKDADICYQNNQIISLNGSDKKVISDKILEQKGVHNLENSLICAAGADYLHIDKQVIEKVFTDYSGLENVVELIATISGVKYYNDSEATNPQSTIAGLDSLSGDILLIAGGYDKNIDYSQLVKQTADKIVALATIGQLTQKLADLYHKKNPLLKIFEAKNLKDAVIWCHEQASSGDSVIMSPAASSFDQFSNLEQRGQLFKQYVEGLDGHRGV